MKKKEAVVKLVFGCIDEVMTATENIHKNIVEKTVDASGSSFQEGGKRKHVYDNIKLVTGKVEEIVSGFIK